MKRIVTGIVAHVDAGKTTLSEALLYATGTTRRLGRVDHGDAFLDTDAMERARGITIYTEPAVMRVGEAELTILDTPGHVDFSAETERTLQALDYAILVVSAADGVQGHTLTLWRLLRRYHVPVFVFVNKMDAPGADRARIPRTAARALFGRVHRFHRRGGCAVRTSARHARDAERSRDGRISRDRRHRRAHSARIDRRRRGGAGVFWLGAQNAGHQ